MQILGPVDTVIPAGQTVQFLCQAVPVVAKPRELLTLQWVRYYANIIGHSYSLLFRENEALPPGRCQDDGDGGLEIQRLEPQDTGVYICVARLGALVNMARANLTVSEAGAGPRGISQPSPIRGGDPRSGNPRRFPVNARITIMSSSRTPKDGVPRQQCPGSGYRSREERRY